MTKFISLPRIGVTNFSLLPDNIMFYPKDRNIHRPKHIFEDNSTVFITARIYAGLNYLYPKKTKNYLLTKMEQIKEKYQVKTDVWVILNNHHHLLIRAAAGNLVPQFIKHLHGAAARFIRKNLPPLVTEHGQILYREQTPFDKREWEKYRRRVREYREESNRINSVTPIEACGMTNFSSLPRIGMTNFSSLPDPEISALLQIKETPIWYQYLDYTIRNEADYYRHLNYVHQNAVKHGYTKDPTDYEFSSYNQWLKGKGEEWMRDILAEYSVADFEAQWLE